MTKGPELRKIRVRHRGAPVFRRMTCTTSVKEPRTAAAVA